MTSYSMSFIGLTRPLWSVHVYEHHWICRQSSSLQTRSTDFSALRSATNAATRAPFFATTILSATNSCDIHC